MKKRFFRPSLIPSGWRQIASRKKKVADPDRRSYDLAEGRLGHRNCNPKSGKMNGVFFR
jgi:hypothetical protein